MPLTERFVAALKELASLERKFVCAFSGGVDSTALLALLAQTIPKERLLAAHLDHNLRPESKAEAAAAQRTANLLGVTINIGSSQVLPLSQARGHGLEEAGRKARYDFLDSVLNAWGGDYIVTGHQANDQAETILMKLLRGGGPSSLAGVRPRQGKILRPLLAFSRQELADFVKSRSLPYNDDPSNADPRFRRNHLRLKIWPSLLEQNPALLNALTRASHLAWAEEDFWDERVARLAAELAEPLPAGRWRIQAAGLGQLSLAERRRLGLHLLRKTPIPLKEGVSVPLAGVNKFLDFLSEPRSNGQGVDLPGGRRVERRGIYLYIGPSSRFTPSSGA
ncbi:MAG: tRNA lysidine(34) synthetase TilS [Deltaproteobacteria bacterium]|jgi:tRNA(Ile)-lysidine synthase|nr:tRNA lysidine(34) synthetase TilS [Deltaproteobacteria bacterium]